MPMTSEQRQTLNWLLFGLLILSLMFNHFKHQDLKYVCTFVPFLEEDELPTDRTQRAAREKVDEICNPPPATPSERE